MVKSVQRILTIWQERSVYPDALIAELRAGLVKEESPPATPAEQKSERVNIRGLRSSSTCTPPSIRPANCDLNSSPAPVESKADLRSKIVAEFVVRKFWWDLAVSRRPRANNEGGFF